MDIKEAEFEKKDFTADITPEDIELMQKMGIPFVNLRETSCLTFILGF